MRKEYDLKKAKVTKGVVAAPKTTKVQVGIRLDGEILNWAMTEAAKLGLGYQTFINMKLHEAMNSGDVISRVERLEKQLKKAR